jgi:hypothetical protein
MTNSRHSTSRSFVLTVDTDMFEPELDEGCTVIIDPDRAFTVGSLVAVQAFAHQEDSFPLLVRWLGSSRRDDKGRRCKPGHPSERVAISPHGLMFLRSDLTKNKAVVLGAIGDVR